MLYFYNDTITWNPFIANTLSQTDSDNDGALDLWEMIYFSSLTSFNPSLTTTKDSDNDGVPDLEDVDPGDPEVKRVPFNINFE